MTTSTQVDTRSTLWVESPSNITGRSSGSVQQASQTDTSCCVSPEPDQEVLCHQSAQDGDSKFYHSHASSDGYFDIECETAGTQQQVYRHHSTLKLPEEGKLQKLKLKDGLYRKLLKDPCLQKRAKHKRKRWMSYRASNC